MTKSPRPSAQARFWAKVRKTETCWLWTACTSFGGYGFFYTNEGVRMAHRVAYQWLVGEIPDGAHLCHSCDVPNCVNPAHLFLGTNADNVADKVAKGRQAKGSKHGNAKLTEADVRTIRSLYRPDTWGCVRRIARMFGVDRTVIHAIVKHERWKHVP